MMFCRRHIGIPVERAPGEWVHSVATPHELLGLLARIYSVQLEETMARRPCRHRNRWRR